MKTLYPLLLAAVMATFAFAPVQAAHGADADSSGNAASGGFSNPDAHWVVRFGVHVVDPSSTDHPVAGMKLSTGNSTRPSGSLEYLLTPNWGFDVLAALPFQHTVHLNGNRAVRTKQLPPTLGVNYHFLPQARFSPFVGAGINYTHFYGTGGSGILAGDRVHIEDSWGAAAHAGLDFHLSQKWLLTADVRWIRIRGDVKVDGANVGQARIDPLVYGVSVGYRF